jgi:hypothetical protein
MYRCHFFQNHVDKLNNSGIYTSLTEPHAAEDLILNKDSMNN